MHGGTHDLCARSSLRVSRRPLFRRYRSGFRLDPDAVVDRRGNPLRAAKVAFGGLHGNVTKQELNLLQLAASGSTKPGAASTEIMRRELADADLGSELTTCQTSFSVTLSPQTLPALLTRRKRLPVAIPAAFVHSSSRLCTQSGTGMVRTCPAFPRRSMIAQCPSRC